MPESLFDATEVANLKQRIASLRADSAPLWGKMTVAQMLAHNVLSLQLALGDKPTQRMFVGRLLGSIVKPMALKDGVPMRRNSPTLPMLVMTQPCEFDSERTQLIAQIHRFAAQPQDGPKRLHGFFGKLTPQESSKLAHKHLDHHLRQFGV